MSTCIWFHIINLAVFVREVALFSDVERNFFGNKTPTRELEEISTKNLNTSDKNLWNLTDDTSKAQYSSDVFSKHFRSFQRGQMVLATSSQPESQIFLEEAEETFLQRKYIANNRKTSQKSKRSNTKNQNKFLVKYLLEKNKRQLDILISQPSGITGTKQQQNRLIKSHNLQQSSFLNFNQSNYEIVQQTVPVTRDYYTILQILHKSLALTNLKTMEKFIQIRSVILMGCLDILSLAVRIFDHNYPPTIILTELSSWELRDYHNKQILSIVFLDDNFKVSLPTLKILNAALYRLHMKKVLFIVPHLETHPKDLLNWCFDYGYWNALLMDYQGSSLYYDFLVQEHKTNFSIEDFLKLSIYWRDLKGFEIRCLMINNPPRAYIFNNTEGKIDYRGYYGRVLTLFAKHYNASLLPVMLSDMDTYRELDCIKYLHLNVVDICGDGLMDGRDYAITNCEEITPSMLMVPHDKPLPKYLYFFKPFQLNVWTIVVMSFLYKILTLAVIHRLQHGFWNFSLHIVYSTLSVVHFPLYLPRVKGKYRRFLELLFISVGFIISNWYLAVLFSILFTSLYYNGINSLEDLRRYNISIMVNEFEYYQLNILLNDPIIMERLLLVPNEVLHHHRRNLDINYAYYNQYDKIDLYLYQQKHLLRPRMKILPNAELMNPVLGGLPMQANWPFEHLLNVVVRGVMDYGLLEKFLEDGMLDGIQQGHIKYFPPEYYTVDALTVEHFVMPALILFVGYSVALLGFVGEIIAFKMKTLNIAN